MGVKLSDEERKQRQKESKRKWFENNPGYLAKYKREKRVENPEKVRATYRAEYHQSIEKRREDCRRWWSMNAESQRDRLTNWKYRSPHLYALKILMRELGKDQIPQEMIDAKVEQLKVMWLIKGVNHEVIEQH